MPEENIDTSAAEITDIPAATEGSGAVETPQPGAQSDASGGFGSIFGAARDAAAARLAAPEGDATDTGEPAAEPDEQIPGDEAGEGTGDGDAPDAEKSQKPDNSEGEEGEQGDAAKPGDPPADADKPARPDDKRTRAYKEIQSENERLTAENTAAITRVSNLETQFEKHGGVEVVENAMAVYDRLASGQAVEVINELPAHEKARVTRSVYETALGDPVQRAFGVNHVLKSDFGLEHDLPQSLLEKAFEFVTTRFNADAGDFEAYLDRELEFANTPERQLERANAELERLKTAPKDGDRPAESEIEMGRRVEKSYNDFEDASFTNLAAPEFKSYGLEVLATDTPDVKEAKEFVQAAVRSHVGFEMRSAKAFEPLLPFWIDGKTEGSWYTQATKAYERSMKAKVQDSLKKVSRLFAKSAPAKTTTTTGNTTTQQKTNIPAPAGKSGIAPQPAKQNAGGGGFSSAFASAKRNAGIG